MQWKIRQNAAEMQETLKSLSSWEKDIKKKERSMRKERKRGGGKKKGKLAVPGVRGRSSAIPAVRGSAGTVVSAPSTSRQHQRVASPL